MQRAVCPGSFDPVHNGHIEIIVRAASLFEEVVVAVSNNPAKSYRFSLQERMDMIVRAAALVGEVVVAVSKTPAKSYRLSLRERMDMISETLRSIQGVTVMPLGTGLIADFAKEQGAQAMVKGIRNSTDLNYEMP